MSRLTDHDDFLALRPFFRIVEEALTGIWTVTTSSTCWPRTSCSTTSSLCPAIPVVSSAATSCRPLPALRNPADARSMLRPGRLPRQRARRDRVEYASEGSAVATGATYANRYVSVLTLEERKVIRWRDYLDPLAVFDALGWPYPPR